MPYSAGKDSKFFCRHCQMSFHSVWKYSESIEWRVSFYFYYMCGVTIWSAMNLNNFFSETMVMSTWFCTRMTLENAFLVTINSLVSVVCTIAGVFFGKGSPDDKSFFKKCPITLWLLGSVRDRTDPEAYVPTFNLSFPSSLRGQLPIWQLR